MSLVDRRWVSGGDFVVLRPLFHGSEDVFHLRVACVPQDMTHISQSIPAGRNKTAHFKTDRKIYRTLFNGTPFIFKLFML